MLSIREQLNDWVFIHHHDWVMPKIKGGYKEPLIFLKVSSDVLTKCKCTKYGHAKPTPKRRVAYVVETPEIPPFMVDNEYGVAYGAVA
jgi:hypothetical protein